MTVTNTQYPLAKVEPVKNKKKKKQEEIKIEVAKRKQHSLVDFFMMKRDDVYAEFLKLPGAKIVGEGYARFLYVPPTREKSVLLVAHIDTVWDDDKTAEIGYANGMYFSTKEKMGIGADDRAGITMLWKLRKLGHALLLPDGEERHGIGSKFLMTQEEWRKEINRHQFAIQMDRMHDKDLAFYEVAAPAFQDYCEKQFPEYKRTRGSYTDICELCDASEHKEDCLDGVNVSIGYYGQHTSDEHIVISEWQKTLSHLHKLLQQADIPKYRHKYEPRQIYTGSSGYHGCGYQGSRNYDYADDYRDYGVGRGFTPTNNRRHSIDTAIHNVFTGNTKKKTNNDINILSSTLVCPKPGCEGMMQESEYRQNGDKCMYCHESFE
jgi:hypothetical protein